MSLLLSVNSNNIKASTDMFTCSSDGAFSPRCLFYNITDLRKRSPKSLNLVRIEKLTILPKAAYQSSFFIALGDDNEGQTDLFTMRLTLFDCINVHDCIKCGFFCSCLYIHYSIEAIFFIFNQLTLKEGRLVLHLPGSIIITIILIMIMHIY